jgi:hypothetical protein
MLSKRFPFFSSSSRTIISSATIVQHNITALLHTPIRHRAFKVFIDKDNPEITLAHSREIKEQELAEGRGPQSPRYLHALVGVSLGHFQKKDYSTARKCAMYAHDCIIAARGSRDSLVYFAATTVANCNRALANEVSSIVNARKEKSTLNGAAYNLDSSQNNNNNNGGMIDEDIRYTTLVMRDAGKKFSSVQDLIKYLHSEADKYELSARRILNLPEKYFMRTEEQHRAAGSAEDSQSSADNGGNSTDSATPEGKYSKEQANRKHSFDNEQRRKRYAEQGSIATQWTESVSTYRSTSQKRTDPLRYTSQSRRIYKPGGNNGKITSLMRNVR